MLKVLYQDGHRYSGVHIVWRALLSFDFYVVVICRLSNWMYRKRLYVLAKVCWLAIRILYACDIDPGATFGLGFKLVHAVGIVVGRYVIAGNGCTIYQNVTLCGDTDKEVFDDGVYLKQPYLGGDSVVIYASAVVIGPIMVGNDTRIAANAVVNQSVGNNYVCMGFNQCQERQI